MRSIRAWTIVRSLFPANRTANILQVFWQARWLRRLLQTPAFGSWTPVPFRSRRTKLNTVYCVTSHLFISTGLAESQRWFVMYITHLIISFLASIPIFLYIYVNIYTRKRCIYLQVVWESVSAQPALIYVIPESWLAGAYRLLGIFILYICFPWHNVPLYIVCMLLEWRLLGTETL